MLAKDRIAIYVEYEGSSDGCAKSATDLQKDLLPHGLYSFLDDLTDDLFSMNREVSSVQITIFRNKITKGSRSSLYIQILVESKEQ